MLISCEKCSTTYVLDDALIPSQGAPVQCTRCGHVFTARLTAGGPEPAPPRAAAPTNSTMVFGNSAAPPPVAAPVNKNQTMMFGTPASSASRPPPSAAPTADTRATMVFGAPGAGAAQAKNQTMMFGTPASNAVTIAPTPAAPSAPAAPSTNQTMVFGTAASNAAGIPPQAPPPSKATMVFGAAPVPAKNQPMTFGAPASNAISAPAHETILEQPGRSNRTVLFGQSSPVQAAPPAPAPAKNATMMFGRPAAIPKVTAGVVELAGMSANEGAPNESTVRVAAAQVLEDHGDGASDASGDASDPVPRHDRTQRFAMTESGGINAPPEGASPIQDRHDRTQRFAMSTTQGARPTVEPLPDDAPSSVFVADTTLPPEAVPTFERSGKRSRTDLNSTLPSDASPLDPPGVSVLYEPSKLTPPEAMHEAEGLVATTLPNLPPLRDSPMAPLALELPPEPMGFPQDLRQAASQNQQQAEDAAALRAARSGGAGRAIVVVLIIVALGLAAVLVYRLFGQQLLGKAVPVEVIQKTDQALATLRFDDEASQDKAIAQLTEVVAHHPTLAEPQSALVIAMALRFDDVHGSQLRAAERLRALEPTEAPTVQRTELEKKLADAALSAGALKAQLEANLEKLQAMMLDVEAGSPAHLALIRADGLARGVLGDGEALTRAVAFKQRTQVRDDWVELIEPEFALNGGSSIDEAILQLLELKGRSSNSTFLRPYVLLARLQLKKGESDRAREQLEQVATMNARHAIARELLASIAK